MHAAQEASQEEKREFLWLGLMNGWVRPDADAERSRFLRIVAKYDLEHFEVLTEMQALVRRHGDWMPFETGPKDRTLVESITGTRLQLLAYVQEFQGDGLIMIQDQPTGSTNNPQAKNVLWRPDADRLLAFVQRPGDTAQ